MPTISSNEIHVKYVIDSSQLQAATQAMSGITAEERKLLADMKKLQDQLNAAGKAGKNAGDNTASSFGKVGEAVKALIPVLSVAFAIDKLKEFSQYAFNTAMQFEQMGKTLAFVTGSTEKANQQFSYMTALAQSMGLNVRSLIDGYKGFAAAASFAGVSQEQINNEMRAFTKAAAALSMSGEDTKLMFMALGQMYSKNKIQAEELRGQLGERLPGAMELLAKSMKIPVTALDELLKKGEIITKEVMPAFANEVTIAFGTAADQTDTLTASLNRFYTALETMIVRVMSGSIGDAIKFMFERLEGVFDTFKYLASSTLQWEQDYQNKRKVEVEKNVLYEIELFRKSAKEKEGLDLSVAEAAQRMLDDQKTGWAAFYKFREDTLRKASENQKSSDKQYLLGFLEDSKKFASKAATSTGSGLKAIGNMFTSPFQTAKAAFRDFSGDTENGLNKMFMDNYNSSQQARNLETQSEIDHFETRLKTLQSFITDQADLKKKSNDEEAEKAGKEAKNRYSRELSMLELQERIAKLNAEATINNEFERNQAIIKIGAEFNEKKKDVDSKYNVLSLSNESQSMKDLRELTTNNFDLREAENNSFYSDIRRNEEKYHKEAYESAVKAFDKIHEARVKADENADKIGKSEFEREIQTSNDKYSKLISDAEEARDKIVTQEGLEYKDRLVLFNSFTDEINALWKGKLDAQISITDKFAKKNEEEFANMFAMIDKLYLKDYNEAKNILDARSELDARNLDARLLNERNYARQTGASQKELELIDKKASQEKIDNQLVELTNRYNLSKTYFYADEKERKKEQDMILADMSVLEAEKTAIELDYQQKRKEYEIEVLKQSMDLASQMVTGLMNLRQQQLDQQLQSLQANAQEEIRLADGNKQKTMAINEKLKEEEKRIRKEQFAAQQTAAVADVVFRTAPLIAQYTAGIVTAPLAIIAAFAAAAQIGFILAQKAPEYAKGTQGKAHKGGPAIVGEVGVEKVITESGKVYYTPPTATLLDLPKGSHVIPNNLLNKQEIFYASNSASSAQKAAPNKMEAQLTEIGSILRGLPIHQINMNERGFEKFVRTEKRTTKILNNQFPAKHK
jgi:tape measure domain-containing protein